MDLPNYRSTLSKERLQLLEAVESNTLAQVQGLVSNCHDLDQDELFSYILLVAALQREHKSISKFLIKEGLAVKSSQKTGSYCTPLSYAVKMNDLDIFKALCRRGASIFDTDINQESALELAMHEKIFDSINLNRYHMINYALNDIVFNKMKDLKPECEQDIALFHAACWTSNLKAIEAFMYFNFSARSRSGFLKSEWGGFTPLHFVLEGTNSPDECASLLLERDDNDFHAQDARGRTCINLAFRKHLAYLYRKNSLIDRIRNSNGGQPINSVDENGLSHFHIFCSMRILKGSSEKNIGLIKHFIDSGVDVNSSVSLEDKDFPGFTALHFAIRESSWEVFKLLLESGADMTKADKSGCTPLHSVCDIQANRLKNVSLLLQLGANPNAQDAKGRTPLHYAFRVNREVSPLDDCRKLLLSKSQKGINHTDEEGLSYLHMACTGNDLKIIESLLMNGAAVNSRVLSSSYPHSGFSPLHFAVGSQQVEVVEFLLTHGADSNCATDAKVTPLHLACGHRDGYFHRSKSVGVDWLPSRAKYIRIIELLIEHGGSVNAATLSGSTPLLQNCLIPHNFFSRQWRQTLETPEELRKELFTRQKTVIDILLRHDADINACCDYEGTVLHILIEDLRECPLNRDLMKIVLEKGINVNAVDKSKGITPLHFAVRMSMRHKLDLSLINFLLEHGADINGKSRLLETPLFSAVAQYQSGSVHEDIIGNLLDHPEIDLNARNDRGHTPLHVAAYTCNFSLIKKLLDSGLDVNVEDNRGNPPFHVYWLNSKGCGQFWRNESTSNILIGIITHIMKLMRLNFSVSQKVQSYLEKFIEYLPRGDLALIKSEIDDEIKKLKSEKMDQYSSLHDIIFKDPNSLAKYSQNENLLRVITTIRSRQDFAIFGDIINRRFVTGCRRHLVLEPAKVALNIITNMVWPYCCSEQILSNLSDQDLKELIESSSAYENRKRPLEDSTPSTGPTAKKSRKY